jgi:hypothetical protein
MYFAKIAYHIEDKTKQYQRNHSDGDKGNKTLAGNPGRGPERRSEAGSGTAPRRHRP